MVGEMYLLVGISLASAISLLVLFRAGVSVEYTDTPR
jgi:hypothetical protein